MGVNGNGLRPRQPLIGIPSARDRSQRYFGLSIYIQNRMYVQGVTLVDASQKKCSFMQQAAIDLGLSNVVVCHARVEAYKPGQPFAQIVSRAFSDLNEFVRLTRHLLAPGGEWLAMKGLYPHEEIAQLAGARLKHDIRLHVPGLDADRHLIVLEP